MALAEDFFFLHAFVLLFLDLFPLSLVITPSSTPLSSWFLSPFFFWFLSPNLSPSLLHPPPSIHPASQWRQVKAKNIHPPPPFCVLKFLSVPRGPSQEFITRHLQTQKTELFKDWIFLLLQELLCTRFCAAKYSDLCFLPWFGNALRKHLSRSRRRRRRRAWGRVLVLLLLHPDLNVMHHVFFSPSQL